MSVAGVFLIQGLEGSRFGMPTLWVLNACADGEGRDEGELVSRGPGSATSREDFPQPLSDGAGDVGTRIAMIFAVMS
jgi:hypothetical protein